MKRGRKSRKEVADVQALRQELYSKHMEKIHPTIKRNLQIDGVLDEVCDHLVDMELRDRRLPFPSKPMNDFNRLYDYRTDSYVHVHYKGKKYRFDEKEA